MNLQRKPNTLTGHSLTENTLLTRCLANNEYLLFLLSTFTRKLLRVICTLIFNFIYFTILTAPLLSAIVINYRHVAKVFLCR